MSARLAEHASPPSAVRVTFKLMNELESAEIQCPYCWETIEILIDQSVPDQTYTEDCSVCCHPILLTVTVDDTGQSYVQATADE